MAAQIQSFKCSNGRPDQSFSSQLTTSSPPSSKIIDSPLHVWSSPQEAVERYLYFPGREPAIAGDVDLLLKIPNLEGLTCMPGSESSRAETTGVRRKEGSYINKSPLTLGTIWSILLSTSNCWTRR